MNLGLAREIIDHDAYARNLDHLRSAGVVLPKISELADPVNQIPEQATAISNIDPNTADSGNLFRVHWHNDATRAGLATTP